MGWLRRRRSEPREAWVVFLDDDHREVSRPIPFVVNCDPLVYRVEAVALSMETTVVRWVRVTDANGNVHETHISHLLAA